VKPPIAALSADERDLLLADIYYLNTAELRGFCTAHSIPYVIEIETPDGRRARSRDIDRKGIVIDRILHFLNSGAVKPATVFRKEIVDGHDLGRAPLESDSVLYGQYKNRDIATLKLMKHLTGGQFEFGAIAQEVLRACWSRNQAPTYREFARLWQKAVEDHSRPNPEWAFLSDRAAGTATPDWKNLRNQKAATVLSLLKKIA
jgi:hypothetical protein